MTWASFGDPSRFEIAVRWTDDPEQRQRRPADGGWSTGQLRLSVGGQVLTRHTGPEGECDAVTWYLLPIFEWLADNWISLLHEERFAWHENSAASAATAAFFALRRWIAASDPDGRARYREVRDWWSRHALQAADASALHPDVVFRRLRDDVEVSWTARPPAFAPDGFRLALAPGAAILPVEEVAVPFWEALNWAVSTSGALLGKDRDSIARLESRITALNSVPLARLEEGYLPGGLLDLIKDARRQLGLVDTSRRSGSVPAIVRWDDPVLMFGGVSPDISATDANVLIRFMGSHMGGSESRDLTDHVDIGVGAPLAAPFEEGYEYAEQVLDDFALISNAPSIDIRALLSRLDIEVAEAALDTPSVRGVALAGDGYSPAILVNTSSYFNKSEPGQRFTLAHEFFHILYDRSRARRVAHTSGPWAPPGVEKRANAFAAMLLMPRETMRKFLPIDGRKERMLEVCTVMEVSLSSLIEHLYNIGLIDEMERERLRA